MLKGLVQFSVRYRQVAIALAVILLGYGFYIARNAKLDVFPDFVPPQVVVQTEAPGFSAEQVELLVTRPIEAAVNGLGSQESMHSESIQGLSIITVVFKEGADIFRVRQMMAEKLGELGTQLPIGVRSPKMSPLTSSTMDLLKIGLVSEKMSPIDLRTFADWTLKPRLLAVPGVAKCSVFGGEVRQLQIQVKPDLLVARGLALSDITAAIRTAAGVRAGGFLETENQRIILRTEGSLAMTADALGKIVVAHKEGFSVPLKEVAEIAEGGEPKFGDALVQGKPGVLMTMSSQFGANTMEVTKALESALDDVKPLLSKQGIQLFPRLHRPATFIETALRNIEHSLWFGVILVAVILFFFLGHIRTAFISLTAIPLSLLTAIILMDRLGVTLNTVTLGGLAIAIGEVVDDAIIDVENIFRRYRENLALPEPRSLFRVVVDASLEVRSSVVYATWIVALVFLPVLTLTGLQGSFFAPLALSYILAILASLAVALILTPALCYAALSRGLRGKEEPRLQLWLKRAYSRALLLVARVPGAVMAAVALLCVLAFASVPFFGGEFLPDFREGHFVLQVSTTPGTSLYEMRRLGEKISTALLKHPKIATVEQQIGRAEQGEDPWEPNRSEFHVELKNASGEEQEQAMDDIRTILKGFPGIQFEVMTFLGDRIGESITGETAPVVINIFGEDLDVLDAKAQEVAQLLKTVPNAEDVQLKAVEGAPMISIQPMPERLLQFGYSPADLLEPVQTAYQGTIVGQVYRENRVTDIAVTLAGSKHHIPQAVGSLLVQGTQGQRLRLSDLAEIHITSGRSSILHEGARRRQTVTCSVSGRDVRSLVDDAKRILSEKMALPAGFYLEFGGAAQAQQAAQRQLLLHSAIAGAGILLLLFVVLGNVRNLVLVLLNLPFALVGGILAIHVARLLGASEAGLSMGSLVGFVTLFGITTRNAIMMISRFEHLVALEHCSWNFETAMRGASERLIPILMTALVTALGLLPLALGSGEAGREIEGPMAIVILGGLVTSTVLNLVVLPVLALRYGHFDLRTDTAEVV